MIGIISGIIGVAAAYLTTFAIRCARVRHRTWKENNR